MAPVINPLVQQALNHLQARRWGEAERLCRMVLEMRPDHTVANHALGVSLQGQGRLEETIAGYRRILAAAPDDAGTHLRLGIALQVWGRAEEAEAHYRRALAARPGFAEAHYKLGHLFQSRQRLDEAIACYRQALALKPDWADAHNNLGLVLYGLDRLEEALACYGRALELDADLAEAHNNCGVSLQALGLLDEAPARYRQALALQPDCPGFHVNLGNLEHLRGRPGEAALHYQRALALDPEMSETRSNLIFNLDLVPDVDSARQQAERRRWGERHAAPLAPPPGFRHPNPPQPERRLRIGYVSADFRRHSAFYTFAPVILNHDRARFEPVCYANSPVEDAHTARLREAVPAWRPVAGLSDTELADLVRADGIDILVDLSGHSAGNRLLTFARKPAPLQVTAWGHAFGTGLAAMDALFSDPVVVPPAERALLAEAVVDLPCCICYQPPSYAPAVRERSAAAGTITFGSLNRLSKIGDEGLRLWRELLIRRPKARLILKDVTLENAAVRTRILAVLTGPSVAADRILLLGGTPHEEHLATYHWIDIALDPFPHGGGITTAEALWMGVPVLTLRGATAPGRVSASILTAAGLADWIAQDRDDYLARALAATGGPGARADVRARLASSPVGDVVAYTRAVEASYRDMWRRWCGW